MKRAADLLIADNAHCRERASVESRRSGRCSFPVSNVNLLAVVVSVFAGYARRMDGQSRSWSRDKGAWRTLLAGAFSRMILGAPTLNWTCFFFHPSLLDGLLEARGRAKIKIGWLPTLCVCVLCELILPDRSIRR